MVVVVVWGGVQYRGVQDMISGTPSLALSDSILLISARIIVVLQICDDGSGIYIVSSKTLSAVWRRLLVYYILFGLKITS